MPNYYEILQISPDATTPEVEAACEAQYNRWRRLVTHHDPGVVNKANQALQFLETARATLLDPAKRAAYDTHLGVKGPVGGLADPQARPRVSAPLLPKPPSPSPIAEVNIPPDTWICPKCHAPNVRKMPYCPQCGEHVARECPKCGELIEKSAQFCSHCGVDIQVAITTQRFEVLREQLQVERRHLDYLQRRYNKVILLPKTEEESGWNLQLAGYGGGTSFDIRQAALIVVFLIVFIPFVVGGVNFCVVMASVIGWPDIVSARTIGGLLGTFVGGTLGIVTLIYVIHRTIVKPAIRTQIELCNATIVQIEHETQNLSINTRLMGD